jgi:hypothetical protein
MSPMIFEVYDALIEAGTSEEKATAAAKAVADYEGRFSKIETELEVIKMELKLIKWASGIMLAGVVSLVVKSLIAN